MPRRYMIAFVAVFCVVAPVVAWNARTILWIGDCDPRGYSDATFMAECASKRFGNYEHGALWFGLDAEADAALRGADVILMGNSRGLYGFSHPALAGVFAQAGLRHYLLGFGHAESYAFARDLLRRNAMRPKIIIMHAESAFNDVYSAPARAVVTDSGRQWASYGIRWAQQQVQRRACADTTSGMLCGGRAPTLYRNRFNGHWITDYYSPQASFPFTLETVPDAHVTAKFLDTARRFAHEFAESCIILTEVPSPVSNGSTARAVGAALGRSVVLPGVDGLATVDHSHLDPPSVDRWAAAFAADLGPHIAACLGGPKEQS